MDAGVERAVGLLPLVLHVDLGEVEGHLIRRDDVTALGSARLVRADQNVLHLDHEVLLLALPGLARGERGVLDVLPGRARLHEGDACRVHAHHEVEVLHRDLAGAASATAGRPAGVRLAPAPRLDVDLVLVLRVGALALDAVELEEVVDLCHPAPRLVGVRSPWLRSRRIVPNLADVRRARSGIRQLPRTGASGRECP